MKSTLEVTIRNLPCGHVWAACKSRGIGLYCFKGRKVAIEEMKAILKVEFAIRNIDDRVDARKKS